jgi:N-acetylmuramoyl-L-alanine amidase
MRYKIIIPICILALTLGWLFSSFSSPRQPKDIEEIKQENILTEQTRDTKFVRVFDITVKPNTHYKQIDFGFKYTSFIIELIDKVGLKRVRYTSSDNEVTVLNDVTHGDHENNRTLSGFVIPKKEQRFMDLFSGDLSGKIRIFLFYAPPIKYQYSARQYKASDSCGKPEMILGSTWREGLNAPIGVREPTTVNHNIIHHAASSNSNSDYINVVRNIYLLHTQSNGWDDIGYNFLIAQNGSIFEGRDPQDVNDIDNIKGAHFCGKNSGTMGICVLGNYMETSPTNESLKSLKHVLVWKCVKSGIDPLNSLPHPSSFSPKLKSISGHRDGCATACPGDSLYLLLAGMRSDIYQQWLNCGGVAGGTLAVNATQFRVSVANGVVTLFPNSLSWTNVEIYSTIGTMVQAYSFGEVIKAPGEGAYIIRVRAKDNEVYTARFLVTP